MVSIGSKQVEGRLNKGDFKEMEVDDFILFHNSDFDFKRECLCKVSYKREYNSFEEYLNSEGMYRCLPGVNTLEEGVSIYHKYYSVEQENRNGIVAIGLTVYEN